MQRKFTLTILSLVAFVVLACSSGTPNTTAEAASPTPASPQPQQSAPPQAPPQRGVQQQAPPPPEQTYQPNCTGCIQLKESDAFVVIKAQRAMMGLQTEWKTQVDQMNQKFSAQQKVISEKLDEVKKDQKVPANYTFDYQNLQWVGPQAKK